MAITSSMVREITMRIVDPDTTHAEFLEGDSENLPETPKEMAKMDLQNIAHKVAGTNHEAVSKSDILGIGAAVLSALGLGSIAMNQAEKTDAILENVDAARRMGDRNFEDMVDTLASKHLMERPSEEEWSEMPAELKESMQAQPVMADASLMGEQGLKATVEGDTVKVEDFKTKKTFIYDMDAGTLQEL
jgi:hypothetical protein